MWRGMGGRLTRIWRQRYPHSLGLLYSAFTQRIGLKPNEEEYILMGMAAYGKPIYRDLIWGDFIAEFNPPRLVLTRNVHRGVLWWRPELTDYENIASSIQAVTEEILIGLVQWLARYTRLKNLVFSGGVALNCVANSQIARSGCFEDLWVNPDPGDAGSCIGAIAALLRRHLVWPSPYIGHNIDRRLDVDAAINALVRGDVIGVANGRAEFGPRALGNRSLLTDPRSSTARDRVNAIKGRELFRPFAPVIMAQYASSYFEMPVHSSPYMQFVARIRDPDRFPAVSHQDGTARVQTLSQKDNPTFYSLLERFYSETGCPMLLNTSLNIKGEPLVNTWADAIRFQTIHDVQIF
jgi:carbamoyltransferase